MTDAALTDQELVQAALKRLNPEFHKSDSSWEALDRLAAECARLTDANERKTRWAQRWKLACLRWRSRAWRAEAEVARLTEQNERLDLDYQAAVHRSNEATKQAALEKIARKAADRDNERLTENVQAANARSRTLAEDAIRLTEERDEWERQARLAISTLTEANDHRELQAAEVARLTERNALINAVALRNAEQFADEQDRTEALEAEVARYRTTLGFYAALGPDDIPYADTINDPPDVGRAARAALAGGNTP